MPEPAALCFECGKEVCCRMVRGLCRPCYMRAWAANVFGKPRPKCSEPECIHRAFSGGICRAHLMKRHRANKILKQRELEKCKEPKQSL